MPVVHIIPSDEFRRQTKRLLKKHRTLIEDLENLQRRLSDNPFAGTNLGGGNMQAAMPLLKKNNLSNFSDLNILVGQRQKRDMSQEIHNTKYDVQYGAAFYGRPTAGTDKEGVKPNVRKVRR